MRAFRRYTLDEFVNSVLKPAIDKGTIFTEVHVHGTWKPCIADFRKNPGDYYMKSMYRAHIQRGFLDIAQHATIDPDGYIWDGRPLNSPPASATSFNDSDPDNKHPFMFEMIGNFDKGKEKLEGAQLATSLGLTAAVMRLMNRDSDMVHFHREFTDQKTCPGSGIEKEWFIEQLKPPLDLSQAKTVSVTVNGNKVGEGFLVGGVTYVPARATVTPLGAQISYDEKTHTVNINN